jgi:amidase
VAAGLVAAAIGTETNGSIVSPASACGIVGLKPTVGLVSRAGIIPITQWQDTAGPMTLTVWDAALLLNVLAGVDEFDPHTGPAGQGRIAKDYTALLKAVALRGVRLGIVRPLCGKNPQVLAVLDTALEALRGAGAEIVEVPELPNEKIIGRLSMNAMITELRSDLNAYLAARGADVKSLADVIAFNNTHADEEMPHFKQEFFEEAERRGTPEAIAEANESRATARRLAGPEGIDATLEAHKLDALICATNDPTSLIDLPQGDPDVRCACTPAAVAGYPHLTVPMGFVDGLPVGLSFFGTAWAEPRLLAYGHAFEQVLPARREPALLTNLAL